MSDGFDPREGRGDPERLLARVRAEEPSTKGSLKCFFGAAPGVGKTYAMLQAAHARRDEGVDVVVGYVETHGRDGTAALLEGLEVLPRGVITYRGRTFEELDLDAALARRPALLLVDELAHSNVPGSRHRKRWQDVLEMLDAGIDVYTTLNVQHVESLNDVVAQITGVVVQETVPDALLERATDVELVDLPPDELLQRLREGKVYKARQAEDAAQSFFRKGNLIALRELALRRTAERVDQQLRGFRQAYGIDATWAVRERVLVSVGPSPLSARLVRAASRMARTLRAEWYAVTVEAPNGPRVTVEARGRINDHLRLAESLGARTATLSGARVADELVAFARRHDVTRIVVGKPTHPRWRDAIFGSLVDEIIRRSGAIDVQVITGDDSDAQRTGGAPLPRPPTRGEDPREYGSAALVVALATGLGCLARGTISEADTVMIYLLAVVLVSFRLGRGAATAGAVLAIAAYDFFFVPPFFAFDVADLRHLVTFAAMLVVGLVVNGLAHRVRAQAEAAREREERTAALYAASVDFAKASGLSDLGRVAVRHFVEVFGGKAEVLLSRHGGALAPLAGATPGFVSEKERGVAQWAFDHEQPAGLGTDTLPSATALHLPLRASRGAIGIVSLVPDDPRAPPAARDPARRRLLEAFAGQTALAFERALLVDEAQESALVVERERLLNALLTSISHDLRTPLASITGATSFLLEEGTPAAAEVRRDMLETVHEEGIRLNRLVNNLLQMTRVSAGALHVQLEWQPLEEVVGIALERLESQVAGLRVDLDLPNDLPAVRIDAVLIEQVLQNLLENAARYGPRGARVLLRAEAGQGEVVVSVDDAGPGIDPQETSRIFDRFYQSEGRHQMLADRQKQGGSGLGLAICKGMVQAHGGRIWVERSAALGGASFRFSLPAGRPPRDLAIEIADVEPDALGSSHRQTPPR